MDFPIVDQIKKELEDGLLDKHASNPKQFIEYIDYRIINTKTKDDINRSFIYMGISSLFKNHAKELKKNYPDFIINSNLGSRIVSYDLAGKILGHFGAKIRNNSLKGTRAEKYAIKLDKILNEYFSADLKDLEAISNS